MLEPVIKKTQWVLYIYFELKEAYGMALAEIVKNSRSNNRTTHWLLLVALLDPHLVRLG